MRRIIGILFLLISIAAVAQEPAPRKWCVGLQVAPQLIVSNLISDVKGPAIGLRVNKKLSKHLFIETGLKMDFLRYNTFQTRVNQVTGSLDMVTIRRQVYSYGIPVLLGCSVHTQNRFDWQWIAGVTCRMTRFDPNERYKSMLPSLVAGTEVSFSILPALGVSARVTYESASLFGKQFTYQSLGLAPGLRYYF